MKDHIPAVFGLFGTDPKKVAPQLQGFGSIVACAPGDRGPDLKTAQKVWSGGNGPTLAVVCRNPTEVKSLRALVRAAKR